jgi:hypothetical protein
VDDAGRGLGTLLAAARAYPKGASAGGVHELLECPVCTNYMFPPIHQVSAIPPLFLLLDWIGLDFGDGGGPSLSKRGSRRVLAPHTYNMNDF